MRQQREEAERTHNRTIGAGPAVGARADARVAVTASVAGARRFIRYTHNAERVRSAKTTPHSYLASSWRGSSNPQKISRAANASECMRPARKSVELTLNSETAATRGAPRFVCVTIGDAGPSASPSWPKSNSQCGCKDRDERVCVGRLHSIHTHTHAHLFTGHVQRPNDRVARFAIRGKRGNEDHCGKHTRQIMVGKRQTQAHRTSDTVHSPRRAGGTKLNTCRKNVGCTEKTEG